MLFLGPSLILFSIRLLPIGTIWLALWLVYLFFLIRHFPAAQLAPTSTGRGKVPTPAKEQ